MNKLKREHILRLIAVIATLFFAFSVINYIIFSAGTNVVFYVNLIIIIILLSVVLLLFEKLSKIDKQKIIDITNNLESKINELTVNKNELENKLAIFEKKENKRFGNLSREAELKKIITEFLKNSSMASKLLLYLTDTFQAIAAILYVQCEDDSNFIVKETFGLPEGFTPAPFSQGEGLNGQVAAVKKPQLIEEIPEDYFNVMSGLGQSKPKYLYLLPILNDEKCIALIELASFEKQDLDEIWVM